MPGTPNYSPSIQGRIWLVPTGRQRYSAGMDSIEISPGLPDPEHCRRARLSRDPRFDGTFFLGVSSTGIYCRPICPARAPAEKNVSYFRLASQAAAAGFRPCLRCRPESAPGSPAWSGSSTTVKRALELIEDGALTGGTLQQLADRLGIGERYLRKLFHQELGISPVAVALNQRLLFAKKLLSETAMPLTQVAYAAGFGSVRRFNSAIAEHFRLTPTQMRGRQSQNASTGICLQLSYRPPYDWQGVVDFLSHHAVAGVESITAKRYHRQLPGGALEVSPIPGKDALLLRLELADSRQLMNTVTQVRRMFDLDANPEEIAALLQQDPALGALSRRAPGARSPGHWSVYESAVRAIVGQQVSTAAARTVLSRLAHACNDPEQVRVPFPTAAQIATLADEHFPMPGRRRDTLREVCRHYSDNEGSLTAEALAAFRGIGPWTVAMVAIRGAGNPDVFPEGDLGLQRAWQALGEDQKTLGKAALQWRPWRAYAANLLWRSLAA